jgi:hypothetical protein
LFFGGLIMSMGLAKAVVSTICKNWTKRSNWKNQSASQVTEMNFWNSMSGGVDASQNNNRL